jgi:hypothetical protein
VDRVETFDGRPVSCPSASGSAKVSPTMTREPASKDRELRSGLIFFALTLVAFLCVTVVAPLVLGDDDGGKAAVDDLKAAKDADDGPAVTVSPSPTAPGGKAPKVTVYLLDGSGARECITSNADWAKQIKKVSGVAVTARDLGATNQTFLQDTMLVEAMPKGKAIVLIGLSVGRYTGEADEGAATYDPGVVIGTSTEVEHKYSEARILSEDRKHRAADEWLAERYPVFEQTYAANQASLDELVTTCLARKMHPVLLELPINLEIVGDSYDAPRGTYRAGARQLAKKYKIPYVDFVEEVGLVNTDFYDLMHLVEPGRVVWQARLSDEVAKRMDEYGMGAGK